MKQSHLLSVQRLRGQDVALVVHSRWRCSPAALCESAWQTPSLYIYEPMRWNMNFDGTSSCIHCAHVRRLVLCVRVYSSLIGTDLLVKVYLHRQHRALDIPRSRLQISVQRSRPSRIRRYAGVHVAYCGVNVRSSGHPVPSGIGGVAKSEAWQCASSCCKGKGAKSIWNDWCCFLLILGRRQVEPRQHLSIVTFPD